MKKMKKVLAAILAAVLALAASACGQKQQPLEVEPSLTQMRSICELAVMECYYHNVAKFQQEVDGILWFGGEKHFWIEYSGKVRYGIDVSLVNLEVNGDQITITIPNAHLMDCDIDLDSLDEESYVVAKGSKNITAEDEMTAFSEAQVLMEEQAQNDEVLLAQAQQRAQTLLENYVKNIGEAAGKTYTIHWEYLDTDSSSASEK